MQNSRFARVRFVKSHIACNLFGYLAVGHIVVDLLNYVVTRTAHCNERSVVHFCVIERTNACKLCCNLVPCHRINTAAALPLVNFLKLNAEGPCANACIFVQILCLILQSTTRIITISHTYSPFFQEFSLSKITPSAPDGIPRQISPQLRSQAQRKPA